MWRALGLRAYVIAKPSVDLIEWKRVLGRQRFRGKTLSPYLLAVCRRSFVTDLGFWITRRNYFLTAAYEAVKWSLYWNLIKLYLDWKEQGQGTGKEESQIAILEKIVTVLRNGESGRQNYHLFSVYRFTVELERTWWLLDWYLLHIRFSRLCNKFGPSNLHALVSFESFLNLCDVQLHPSSQYPLTFYVVKTLLLYTALALTCGLYSALLHPASLLWECSCIMWYPEETNKDGNEESGRWPSN